MEQGYFTIGRALDPSYWTNRIVIGLCALTAVISALHGTVSGLPLKDIALQSLTAPLSAFIPWALAREMDPDNEVAALLTLPIGVTTYVLWGGHMALGGFAMVLCARMLSKTTGPETAPGDMVATAALALSSAVAETPVIGIPAGLAHCYAGAGRNSLLYRMTGIGCIALSSALLWKNSVSFAPAPYHSLAAAAVLAIFIGWRLSISLPLTSRDDRGLSTLERKNVNSAAILIALAAGMLTLAYNGTTWQYGLGLWAALAGVACYGIVRRMTYKG